MAAFQLGDRGEGRGVPRGQRTITGSRESGPGQPGQGSAVNVSVLWGERGTTPGHGTAVTLTPGHDTGDTDDKARQTLTHQVIAYTHTLALSHGRHWQYWHQPPNKIGHEQFKAFT